MTVPMTTVRRLFALGLLVALSWTASLVAAQGGAQGQTQPASITSAELAVPRFTSSTRRMDLCGRAAAGAGQQSDIFTFASDVDADQRMEIDRMSAMLQESRR